MTGGFWIANRWVRCSFPSRNGGHGIYMYAWMIYAVIKMVQRELFGGWGGKRVDAGRKKKPGAGVSHHARPRLASRFPVHVTLKMRAEVFGLRSKRSFRVIERAFYAGND